MKGTLSMLSNRLNIDADYEYDQLTNKNKLTAILQNPKDEFFPDQQNQTTTKEENKEEKKEPKKRKRKGPLASVPEELVDTMNSLMDGTVSDKAMAKLRKNKALKRGKVTKLTEESNYEELTKI